ncbi:MAG: efflux RND transporter periplasmic adaptor subunit [Burkholderiales bacterium]|nr:efflux RND transporter periplasmic adaptor subunit [Burkholderiales bacterium]
MRTQLRFLLPGLLILVAGGFGAWWYLQRPAADASITLYGNIEFRQASIPFNGNDRIAEVLVEEGAVVKHGQLLARLDTGRLLPQLAQAKAAAEAQKAVVDRLRNGTRKEEIAQARATLDSARAEALNATVQFERRKALGDAKAVSQQEVDQARAAAEMAAAKVDVAQNALKLALIGPRVEDIAQAQAQLQSYEAQLELLRRQVADAELRAPFDALVQSRLMEPGEMAAPNKPVFSLATTGTKWVRAYVAETNLGHVRNGSRAQVRVDSMPERALDGWVGFISSVAEFTPKTVQTEELRTNLVYEVRVFVQDADNVLRLGMPASVKILPDKEGVAGVQAK